jgi:hypothetical protein
MRTGIAALIIAHPGHALRIHRWLELNRPTTFVLTKGDGAAGPSRVASTTRVLEAAGARAGSVYGRLEDRAIYAALLRRDEALFLGLRDEIADALATEGVELVAADAEEGYNPSHDVCRYLAESAAAVAATRGRVCAVYDFALVGDPAACPAGLAARAVRLRLDDEALARKLEASRRYPELQAEVAAALARHGADAFRTECLRPVVPEAELPARPFYETYGERQVAAGRYAEVIRFEEHVRPIRDALRRELRSHAAR